MLKQLTDAIDNVCREKEQVIVALEGGSASGKSTLGKQLQQLYGCTLIHMDDFFLQPHQRTPERFGQPGGNVDWERCLKEVLLPLQEGRPFSYRVFDCSVMDFGASVQVQPVSLTILEGVYSMHPALRPYVDLGVFLKVDADTQSRRILRRNGERMHKRFMEEWIPLENVYFAACHVQEACRLTISMTDEGEL